MPLVLVISISNPRNDTVLSAAAAAFLPNHLHRSGVAGQALVLARVENRDDSEDEPGESEDEGEGDDQDCWSESGWRLARVEELGG